MQMRRIAAALTVASTALFTAAFTPSNTECLAPAAPGGGWDFTCRSVAKILDDQDLVPGTMQVSNMVGGVGAVAFANVMSKRNADPNLIVATSTVGITQIAQNKYPGEADTMRWLAMLGADVGVVVVKPDAPWKTINDLVAEMKAKPEGQAHGGSSGVGGWDHLRLLLLGKAGGLTGEDMRKVRWVQYSGGSEAVMQLMGGFLGVVTTDLGEIAGFIEAGQVRVLAVMSDEPLPGKFADLPTARSQGLEVSGYNWRGFYMGGKVQDDAYDFWVAALEKLYNSDDWQKLAVGHGLTPIWRGGKEFDDFVRQSVTEARDISREIGVIK